VTDFGDVMISAFPLLIKVIIILLAAYALIRLTALAFRVADGRQLRRVQRLAAIDQAARTPVTRPMSTAEAEACYGPKLGELTSPDHVITGQLAAVQDALTPRMVAPTRADLTAVRQRCTRCRTGNAGLPCMCGYDCYAADCLAETPGVAGE
jgi:hypothetical protein